MAWRSRLRPTRDHHNPKPTGPWPDEPAAIIECKHSQANRAEARPRAPGFENGSTPSWLCPKPPAIPVRFNPKGPKLSAPEWQAVLDRARKELSRSQTLVLSGGLP